MTRLRLGTRGSRLALVQARAVAARLEAATPGVSIEIVEIRTSGDRLGEIALLGPAMLAREALPALTRRYILAYAASTGSGAEIANRRHQPCAAERSDRT